MDWIAITKLVLDIAGAVGPYLIEAFKNGDTSALDRPLRDILSPELRTAATKHMADAAAAKKFGGTPPAPPSP